VTGGLCPALSSGGRAGNQPHLRGRVRM